MRKQKIGKYKVTINVDATVDVVVEANSQEEAFEKASIVDAEIRSVDDLCVFSAEVVGCEDENGNYTECPVHVIAKEESDESQDRKEA